MSIQIQFRRGTAAQWTAANTVLAAGEMAIETDTNQFKVGDGVTAWTSLAYGGLQGEPGLTEGEPIMIRDTMTAGGTIAAGDAVWVDSAGKIQKGLGSLTPGTHQTGVSYHTTGGGTTSSCKCTWISDTTFIIGENGNTPTTYKSFVRAGTVSGTTITLGDWVELGSYSSTANLYSIIRLSDTAFVAMYKNGSGYLAVRVGTVSGTTITLGTAVAVGSAAVVGTPQPGWLSRFDDTHFVVGFAHNTTTWRMNACSVSGNTITEGTDSDVSITAGYYPPNISILDSSHFVFSYTDDGASAKTMCCSISGTTITQGTAVTVVGTLMTPVAYGFYTFSLSSTKFVAVICEQSVSVKLKYRVGTVSGTTITYQSIVTDDTAYTNPPSATLALRFNKNTDSLFSVAHLGQATGECAITVIDCSSAPLIIISRTSYYAPTTDLSPLSDGLWLQSVGNTLTPFTLDLYLISISASGSTAYGKQTIFTDTANPAYTYYWSESNPSGTKLMQYYYASSAPTGYTNNAFCCSISSSGGTTAAGIALESASLNESCDVALQAAALDLWTGLTIGATYYVTAAGGLSTTAQTINGASSKLGIAVTTSKILINTAKTDPKQLY